MSFSAPSMGAPPPPPPPPPNPPLLAGAGSQASIAAQRAATAAAAGQFGFDNTNKSGPQGAPAPTTTKKNLGGEQQSLGT